MASASRIWGPCESQLPDRTDEEPAAEDWVPAGHYVDLTSIGRVFSAYVPGEPNGGQMWQPVGYYSAAPPYGEYPSAELPYSSAKPEAIQGPAEVFRRQKRVRQKPGEAADLQDGGEAKISEDSHASAVFQHVACAFGADIGLMKEKMHRYPACLRGLVECYTVPRIVAIGPYHSHRDHLKQAEKVKHMAAYHCIKDSRRLVEDLYGELVPVADGARSLYDKDVMEGIGYDHFRHMMFFDACFLVQYMLMQAGNEIDSSLRGFMGPNRIDILRDVMLLENQLPWQVVETVRKGFRTLNMQNFISRLKGCLQDSKEENASSATRDDEDFGNYEPPHLLGLLRHCIVGTRCQVRRDDNDKPRAKKPQKRSTSLSAIELAEIGIELKPNKTSVLIDMDLKREWILFAKLFLAPVSLDRDRASYLVNMAAFELCTVRSFSEAKKSDSAVCSYLLLLAMLVSREEDVHELRARGLLQGGGGLTNEEVLRFFASFQGLRLGSCYSRIMQQIEYYKQDMTMWTKVYAFTYKNKTIICAVASTIAAVCSIIATLFGILEKLKSFKAAP